MTLVDHLCSFYNLNLQITHFFTYSCILKNTIKYKLAGMLEMNED